MKIGVGSDHAAFEFKEKMKNFIASKGFDVMDYGTCSAERVDYCDYGFKVAEAVASGECDSAVIFCGTGAGISISANKVKGIRCVVCSEPYTAKLSRQHNDTNILALGARVIGDELAKMIIEVWLFTDFKGGRHKERIDKISAYEEQNQNNKKL